jgi:chaperonin GroES
MLTPAGHKILVRPRPVEERTESGLYLALNEKQHQAATTEGIVVALGPTAYLKVDDGRPWCKVGDEIKFAKYAGALVVDPETKEELVVLIDIDVVAIIKSGETKDGI